MTNAEILKLHGRVIDVRILKKGELYKVQTNHDSPFPLSPVDFWVTVATTNLKEARKIKQQLLEDNDLAIVE